MPVFLGGVHIAVQSEPISLGNIGHGQCQIWVMENVITDRDSPRN